MKPSIAIIRHIGVEGPGTIGDVLESRGLSCTFIDAWKDPIPQNADGFAAVVILGGPMGVYEQDVYPFLRPELSFIRNTHEAQIPVIGICLGSQMVAQALGGRVYKGGTKEIGWYNVHCMPGAAGDRLFGTVCARDGSSEGIKVFQWHGDTFDLPDGAVVLAGSALYRNQAFRMGNSYGLQFHVEVRETDIRNWIHEYKAELATLKATVDPEVILRDTALYVHRLNEMSREIFSAFFAGL